MTDYIVDDEQQLSPVVVVTTALLVATFVVGAFYQLVQLVL